MTVNRGMAFVIMCTVYIIAIIVHLMAAVLFDPSGQLFELAADAERFSGERRATLWHEILTVWVPVLAVLGVTAWAFVNEYRRQTQTAVRRSR